MPQNTFSTSQQYFLGGLFWMVEKVRWVQNTLLQFCMHLWSDVPTKDFSSSASVTYNYFYVYKQVKREREIVDKDHSSYHIDLSETCLL